ncbi:MAG: MFS transporter [Rhodoferax sp.]|jgi:MFS family permease|nr:MFS transporter [Rhodoferax sp.]
MPADTGALGRRHLAPLVLVNLGVGMHAMIWYMASTVMPSVVQDLGSADSISWATTIYLVTTILGAVAMAGAKARWGAWWAMVGASVLVTLGSLAAAAAPSIFLVLVGRALQGLGEGMLVALSYALVRELFNNAQVPRVFGIQAATWGITIFLGPLAGGWLTETWSWRAAFIGAAVLPIPMLAMGARILRRHPRGNATVLPAPWWRLIFLTLGVIAIAAADRPAQASLGVALVLAGVAMIAVVLRLDKRRAPHLFPTSFPQLHHPVSLGLWILLLMPLAQAPVYVYGPYILQMYRGLSPTLAGYFGATHALAWSITAILMARLHPRWQNASILSGPALLTAGLAGLALSTATQPLGLVLASLVVVGVGFGVCNMFVNQRIMASVQPGQEDETAGAIPTLQGLGGAISAALAGLAGNAIGLDNTLTVDVVQRASLALYGGGALLSLLAVAMAWRFLQALPPPR